ncbi:MULTISPECIES: hypothetical protein [unclassified Nocardioides]|uniref:hypothetical protein n=1 Tax=unclassified Nocardioides TaxID=2615069 RepID=UPI0006F9AEBA|nr:MULTISPECIES: hypothetical protein [unclassified Nocardioides]KQY62632.1 hypothetical protein ASD30_23225 [Nocardioides sp. Root140]KQZ75967.1 hypothetical protein ASD66_06640 [Nocardioides sp. Root151]
MTTRTETQPLSTSTARRSPIARLLLLDAGVSGLNAVAYLAGATLLDDVLGPSVPTLELLGAFLLVWAGALAWIATRDPVPAGLAREVVIGNLVWVAGSVAVAFGLLSLTGIGLAWCLMQAVVVAGFGAAQYVVLRGRA